MSFTKSPGLRSDAKVPVSIMTERALRQNRESRLVTSTSRIPVNSQELRASHDNQLCRWRSDHHGAIVNEACDSLARNQRLQFCCSMRFQRQTIDDLIDDASLKKGYAYHEAGHAVLQLVYGLNVTRVSILPIGKDKGGVTQAEGPHPVILNQLGVQFEGTVARD